jgi:hypothetical protein
MTVDGTSPLVDQDVLNNQPCLVYNGLATHMESSDLSLGTTMTVGLVMEIPFAPGSIFSIGNENTGSSTRRLNCDSDGNLTWTDDGSSAIALADHADVEQAIVVCRFDSGTQMDVFVNNVSAGNVNETIDDWSSFGYVHLFAKNETVNDPVNGIKKSAFFISSEALSDDLIGQWMRQMSSRYQIGLTG